MKLKDGFMLRWIVDMWIVVPLGERVVDFNGILTLSSGAAKLWNRLAEGEAGRDDLLHVLLDAYEIDEATASQDLDAFIASLDRAGLLAS